MNMRNACADTVYTRVAENLSNVVPKKKAICDSDPASGRIVHFSAEADNKDSYPISMRTQHSPPFPMH